MKWGITLLLCVSTALAQNGPDAAQSHYRQQGATALQKERARSKANLCTDAENGGNSRIGQCLADEGKITEQNYLAYIRSIGALLRLGTVTPQSPPQKLSFDLAEEAWQEYREKSCRSMATQWEGGDEAPVAYVDCRLKLTWNHMNELADLYSDLWDGRIANWVDPSADLPAPLASVLSEARSKTHIRLLVPSQLPQPISDAKYATLDTVSDNEYAISLYYKPGVGDSGFAASFEAKADANYRPQDIPNTEEIKLSDGVTGYFRPVSCGGSCAPANLWWEEDRVLYQVQIVLSPDLPEGQQQKLMAAVANSAIIAGKR